MTGIHHLEVTYADGRTETRECPCPWCEGWRAMGASMARRLAESDPPVWPEWLGPKRATGYPDR